MYSMKVDGEGMDEKDRMLAVGWWRWGHLENAKDNKGHDCLSHVSDLQETIR